MIDGNGIYYYPLPVRKDGVVPGPENEGPGKQTAKQSLADNTQLQGQSYGDSTKSTVVAKPLSADKVLYPAEKFL